MRGERVTFRVRQGEARQQQLGPSVEIFVFLCEGVFSGRFLIMAAEMEPSTTDGDQAQFWEEIPRSKMTKQRLNCHIPQDVKPVLRLVTNDDDTPVTSGDHRNTHVPCASFVVLLQVMASSCRLEQKLDHCLWTQMVFIVLVMGLTALWGFTLYIHYSVGYSNWTTAKN